MCIYIANLKLYFLWPSINYDSYEWSQKAIKKKEKKNLGNICAKHTQI